MDNICQSAVVASGAVSLAGAIPMGVRKPPRALVREILPELPYRLPLRYAIENPVYAFGRGIPN
jgi:hypothetical protein